MRSRMLATTCAIGLLLLSAGRLEASALAYVLSNGANQVSIFDLTTRSAPRSLSTGAQPAELLIHPNNRLAFVSNSAGNTVTVLDLRQEQVLATVNAGTIPGALLLSRDGKTLYVANEGSNDVTVIDVLSHDVVATIPVGITPVALNLAPDGRTVYVVNFDSGTVTLIDVPAHVVRGQLTVGSKPNQFALSPDLRFGYVVNTLSNNVTQIDLSTNVVLQAIPVGTNPVNIAFSPDSSTLFVVNRGSNTVSVVQVQPVVRAVRTIAVDSSPVALALTSDGFFGFLTNSGSSTVSVIDTRAGAVVDTVQLPTGSQPFAVALDPDENFVFVTNLGTNTVTVLDANTDAILGSPIVGQAPTQFSFLNFPILSQLRPTSGLPGGTIVLEGEGFLSDSAVLVGGTSGSSQFIEHDRLRATVPQLGLGTYSVLVRNPDASTTDLISFTVVSAPTIAAGGVAPSQGPVFGGTQVTIAGTGFQLGVRVSFGGSLATVVSQGSTSVVVNSPPHPSGPADVAVVNPDGTRTVLSGGFTYAEATDPILQVNDSTVQFVARRGETRLLTQNLAVTNLGTGPTTWFASVILPNSAPTSWLSTGSNSGTIPSTLLVRADPNGLPTGTYTGSINVVLATSNVLVNVTLTILETTDTNLFLSHLADGGGLFTTTLALMNPNDNPANVSVNFRDDDGQPLRLTFTDSQRGSTLNVIVPPRSARFLQTDGSSLVLTVGSAQVTSDLPLGGSAIFRQRVAGRPDFEAAVLLVQGASKLFLSADDTTGFASGLAITNPNYAHLAVRMRIRETSGLLLGEVRRDLQPFGHFSAVLRDLLPSVVGRRTTIEFTALNGSPLTAVGIRANETGALTTLPVIDPYTPAPQTFLAQVADGRDTSSFRTTFLVFNPANFSLNAQMDFFDDNGNPMNLGFVDGSSGTTVLFPILPVGLLTAETNAASTSIRQGFARVAAALPVAGTALFRQRVSGRPDFEAAVPLVPAASDVLLVVDNTTGFSSGVAIGNALDQLISVTLTFRDETGALVAQTNQTLTAHAHTAFVLRTLMPASDRQRGALEVESSAGAVTVLGIRAQDSGALTTLPVIPR